MQSQIDEALRRAILREIGERLQICLRQEELPASLRVQLDRLCQLDDRSPATKPSEKISKAATARKLLSRMWTIRSRTSGRRRP
jgi:hypothetical protein